MVDIVGIIAITPSPISREAAALGWEHKYMDTAEQSDDDGVDFILQRNFHADADCRIPSQISSFFPHVKLIAVAAQKLPVIYVLEMGGMKHRCQTIY